MPPTKDGPGALAGATEASGDRDIAERRSRSFSPSSRPLQLAPDAVTAASWGDRPPPHRMVLRMWRPMRRNTLCGFVDVGLPNGLHMDDIAVHVRGDRAWASLPARPMLDEDGQALRDDRGKIRYAETLCWRSRDLADQFSAAAVELVRRANPGALDEA